MELTKGLVVRALAGRDMGNFFVVLSVDGGYASSQTANGGSSLLRNEKISVISSGRISSWNWTVSRIKSSEMC